MKRKKNDQIGPLEFAFLRGGYQIESLRKKGLSNEQIANRLKIPKAAVNAYLGERRN